VHQAERVDRDVAFRAFEPFGTVIAGRIVRRPPFSAPFTLWLSTIEVVGRPDLPSISRTAQ
jgi:hypothetical protein